MIRDTHPIREYELHAYADGALDAPARVAVEAYLADDPAAAEEVDGWKWQNEALRALYSRVVTEPVPARLDAYRIKRESRIGTGQWQGMAAAAVLLLAIGAAAGWYGRGSTPYAPAEISLVDEAIAAHRIYSSEIFHPVEVWSGEKDHLQAWLSKRLARTLAIPDLTTAGLSLVGGRLLPAAAGPAAQFMYEDDTGHRVSLYIVPAKRGVETSFHHAATGKLEAFFWTDEAISCALVGDLPRDRMQAIATQAYKQLG